MFDRENYLRTVRFEGSEHVPVFFAVNPASYFSYDQNFLFDQMQAHRRLFPDFIRPEGRYEPELSPICKKGAVYYDDFGCRWATAMDGILGTVVEHPLADLSKLSGYRFPDPAHSNGLGPIDWAAEERRLRALRAEGRLAGAGLRHGHTFLQMCDIRGYENLLFDMMDGAEYLPHFLERLTDFNLAVIDRYLQIGVDIFQIPEDLGMQVGPMLSPDKFDEYIVPCYRRMTERVRSAGVPVHMHSDGDIRTLTDSLMSCGIDVLNLQDLVNGIDWIKANLKGKVCIDLDIDRQQVTRFGSPQEVDALIRSEISELGDRTGGLMLTYGLYPGIPEKNVAALMDALERYMFY